MENYKIDAFHVGVKALIFNAEGEVLLLERDHPIKQIYWDLPGGRLHKGESFMDTLVREVKEETGLDLLVFVVSIHFFFDFFFGFSSIFGDSSANSASISSIDGR